MKNIGIGALILAVGIGKTMLTYSMANPGGTYTIAFGAIIVGLIQVVVGLTQLGEESHG